MSAAVRPARLRVSLAWIWLGLAAASAGVLVDLATHWAASPWARYSALFVPLSALCIARGAGGPPAAHSALLVAGGALIEVLAIGGGFERFGRPGLALALVGMAGLHGVSPWPRRASVLWIVPIPAFLASPFLANPFPITGVDPSTLRAPVDTFSGLQGGLPLVALFAGLGWQTSALAGCGLRDALLRALRWGALGIPVHLGCLLAAGIALPLTAPGPLRRVLWEAPWLVAALVGLGCLARGAGGSTAGSDRAR